MSKTAAAKAEPKKPTSKISFVQKVLRGDTYLVMADSAIQPEDEFEGGYYNISGGDARQIMQPTFNPRVLQGLVQKNNTLLQCVEVMVVNIDGTGYEFVPVETDGEVDEKELKALESIFNEPYPGTNFITERKALRRDIEGIGYGFMEILRTATEDVAGFRRILAASTRLVRLGEALQVKRTINRNGTDVEFTVWERERRFVQLTGNINQKYLYFKEYGASRHCHKHSGEWETDTHPIAVTDRATEVVFFGNIEDAVSPYHVPKWINQLPSVMGSRKAEESNLEYFDAGGLPPAIVFVQGGTLAGDVSEQLKLYLSGATKNRNRAAVVEAQSSSGSLDSTGQVKVTVERFGAEKANDSMFMNYDIASAKHVRMAFRFSELFLGDGGQANYATALTAYMVAEAQVFAPERLEFDDIINKTIIKAMKVKTGLLRSKPITLKNADVQLKGIALIEKYVEAEDLVDAVNDIAGTSLPFSQDKADAAEQMAQLALEGSQIANDQMKAGGVEQPGKNMKDTRNEAKDKGRTVGPKSSQSMSAKSATEMFNLVQDYAQLNGMGKGKPLSPTRKAEVLAEVEEMGSAEEQTFYEMLGSLTLGSPQAGALMKTACDHADHEHVHATPPATRNQLRKAAKEDNATLVAPILDAIAENNNTGMKLAQETMTAVVNLVDSSQKRTDKLLEHLVNKEERPINITATLQPRASSGEKVVKFPDGRTMTIKDKA